MGRAHDGDDPFDLVHIVLALEDGRPSQQFREDAPDRPNVDGFRVVLRRQNYLGGSIPSSHHVIRYQIHILIFSSQSQVSYLQLAILIHQQIVRLQVSMDHLSTMQILHSIQYLKHKVFYMLFTQNHLAIYYFL